MDKYRVRDLETRKENFWTLKEILHEINRDRSEEWTDYDESDWQDGWFEWCEGDCYELLGRRYDEWRKQYYAK